MPDRGRHDEKRLKAVFIVIFILKEVVYFFVGNVLPAKLVPAGYKPGAGIQEIKIPA
jgi:hypothetical protein